MTTTHAPSSTTGGKPNIPFERPDQDAETMHNLWQTHFKGEIVLQRTVPNDACELSEGFAYSVSYSDYKERKPATIAFLKEVYATTNLYARVLGPTLQDLLPPSKDISPSLEETAVIQEIEELLEGLKLFDNIKDDISHTDVYLRAFNSLMLRIKQLGEQEKVKNSIAVTRTVCSTQEKCLGSCERFYATLVKSHFPEDIDAALSTKDLPEEGRFILTAYRNLLSNYHTKLRKLGTLSFGNDKPTADYQFFEAKMWFERANSVMELSKRTSVYLHAFFDSKINSALNEGLHPHHPSLFFIGEGTSYRLEDLNCRSFDKIEIEIGESQFRQTIESCIRVAAGKLGKALTLSDSSALNAFMKDMAIERKTATLAKRFPTSFNESAITDPVSLDINKQLAMDLVDSLTKMLDDPSSEKDYVVQALAEIAKIHSDISLKTINKLLSMFNEVFWEHKVLNVMIKIGRYNCPAGQHAVDKLIELLQDESLRLDTRVSIAKALRQIKSAGGQVGPNGVAALSSLLLNEGLTDTGLIDVSFALGIIAKKDSKSRVISILLSFLKNPSCSPYTRSRIAEVLGDIEEAGGQVGNEGMAALIEFLQDKAVNTFNRKPAVYTLEKIAKKDSAVGSHVVTALSTFFHDQTDSDILSDVASVLGRIGKAGGIVSSQIVHALSALIQDQSLNTTTRIDAAHALGEIGEASDQVESNVVEALITLSKPSIPLSYYGIVPESLCTINTSVEDKHRIISFLISVLQDKKNNEVFRFNIVMAIGTINASVEDKRKIVSALLATLHDESIDIRFRASFRIQVAIALEKIDGAIKKAQEEVLDVLISTMSDDESTLDILFRIQEIIRLGGKQGQWMLDTFVLVVRNQFFSERTRRSTMICLSDIYYKVNDQLFKQIILALLSIIEDKSLKEEYRCLAATGIQKMGKICGQLDLQTASTLVSILQDLSTTGGRLQWEASAALASILPIQSFDEQMQNKAALAAGKAMVDYYKRSGKSNKSALVSNPSLSKSQESIVDQTGVHLAGVNLAKADLKKVDFRNVLFIQVDLTKAIKKLNKAKANLQEFDIAKVINWLNLAKGSLEKVDLPIALEELNLAIAHLEKINLPDFHFNKAFAKAIKHVNLAKDKLEKAALE